MFHGLLISHCAQCLLCASQAQLSSVISSAKHTVKECREQYEHMLAEDKDLERAFKRDFADCEPYVDQLYKLFKRRPRFEHWCIGDLCTCTYMYNVCVGFVQRSEAETRAQ